MISLIDEIDFSIFKKKDIEKTKAFYEIILKHFQFGFKLHIDLCAGNGLCSLMFQSNGLTKQSILIDKRKPIRFEKISRLFIENEYSFQYFEEDINNFDFSFLEKEKNLIITGVHACGNLTDKIINLAITYRVPFAIMTCCHGNSILEYKLENPLEKRLLFYKDKSEYIDRLRSRYVSEQGLRCFLEEIPEKITPMNRVIVGIY